MRIALFAIVLGALPGCEISVFGSPPTTIIGTSTGSGGPEGHACSEPDDARRAREDEDACGEICRIEAGAITGECGAATIADGIATLDLADADGLVMRLEICDPSGLVFELGDARLRRGSSHDARLLVEATTMTVHGSEGAGLEPSSVRHWIAPSGCSTRTIVLTEQLVYFAEAEAGLCGTGLLRISPPTDAEGRPDALWHLALGRALEGEASGSGLRSVDLCFW